jgi:DNA-binding CsgD family transcriptional regulator
LAQGQVEAANVAIRRIAEEVRDVGPRARVLDAYVEIVLATQDVPAARSAANELSVIAMRWNVPFLHALASRALGSVVLAEGNPHGSLAELRRSWSIWCELDAPYEAARVRTLIAQACRALKDEENARLELAAARETFERLGASKDLSRVQALLPRDARQSGGPLTGREVQVLRLVASGMTNRAIAGKLKISEKTVARHLSNIFTKLDLSSRTAAAAYAYDHKLV